MKRTPEQYVEEEKARARVIKAAPAMLKALKDFVELRKGDLGPDLEPLEDAIAEAEGRSPTKKTD